MNVPEITLKKLLDYLIEKVIQNYNSKPDEKDTFLYKLFNGNFIEGYDYFKQAKALLLKGINVPDPRKIETRIFFDRSRASSPTLHITLPSEQHAFDGISYDKGYSDPSFTDTSFTEENTRGFQTKYQIIATSDNTFEVLIMYYLLKALIVSNIRIFELNGLRNIKQSGQDLLIRDEFMPQNIYMRGLTIDCFYEFSVPEMEEQEMLLNIDFEGSVIDNTLQIITEQFRAEGEVTFIYSNSNLITA